MVWRTVVKQIGLWLLNIGFTFVFNAIDKDKDGKLSKQEINEFVKYIESKIKKIKK